jgi:hypothetical protein
MTTALPRITAFAAALVGLSFAFAQPPAPQAGQRPPTIEERVTALERDVASVRTRFELRESQQIAAPSSALEPRVTSLERTLERLAMDLQRVERMADNAQRQADSAARAADYAQRSAQDAERIARDAQLRAR